MNVWVVTGKSESGDEYGPVVFERKPTDKTLKQLVFDWDGNDGSGPGDYGSYVHLTKTKVAVR